MSSANSAVPMSVTPSTMAFSFSVRRLYWGGWSQLVG